MCVKKVHIILFLHLNAREDKLDPSASSLLRPFLSDLNVEKRRSPLEGGRGWREKTLGNEVGVWGGKKKCAVNLLYL